MIRRTCVQIFPRPLIQPSRRIVQEILSRWSRGRSLCIVFNVLLNAAIVSGRPSPFTNSLPRFLAGHPSLLWKHGGKKHESTCHPRVPTEKFESNAISPAHIRPLASNGHRFAFQSFIREGIEIYKG